MPRAGREKTETPIAGRAARFGGCCILLAMASAGTAPAVAQISKPVIKGRIVAVDTGEPISGARVKIKRLGSATTDARGRYRIRAAKGIAGEWAVVISAPGHWRRKTWLVVPDSARKARADWNILPRARAGFDLEMLSALTRGGSRSGGTARWEEVPVFRIFANRLECRGNFPPDERCPEWTVTASAMNSTIMEWFLAAIADVPTLMGGITPTVEIIRLPPGTSISTDSVLVRGTFTLGEHVGNLRTSFPTRTLSETISAHVVLNSARLGLFDRGAALRLVAGGLGYIRAVLPRDLCADLLDRGMSTVFCLSHGLLDPTDLDATMGRALYTRAIGNRYPDVDPRPDASR